MLKLVQTPEDMLEETVQEMDRNGISIDLQKILELKGLKKADTERLIEAYTVVYAAVLDPSNGYGDVKGAIRHGPNALGTLLGG